jgi:membrane fusion protein, heavy metal efflux system
MNFIRIGKAVFNLAAILGMVFLPGCDHGHHHSHDHDEDEVLAQITVWSGRHEVFAEHPPLISGVPALFLTHITDLQSLEPVRAESITFILSLEKESPFSVTSAPAKPGIYEPKLTFPRPGIWNVTVVIPSGEGEDKVALPRVPVFTNEQEALRANPPEPPEGITFLKEQQWKVRVQTELAEKRELIERLRAPAIVAARPGSFAQITPPIAGRLLLPAGAEMPLAGDRVDAGQVLALLQPSFSEIGARLIEAEGEVIRTQLEREQAELVLQRTRKLFEAKARSEREVQEAEFALKLAQARHDAALALQASYRQATRAIGGGNDTRTDGTPGTALTGPSIELISPISGTIVSQLGAAVGEFISVERPVFTVLNADTVFVQAHIPEARIGRLSAAKGASLELPEERGRFVPITGEGQGRLIFLGLQVDPGTRTVPLTYEVNNSQGRLRVGQSVTLHVETTRSEGALAIPDSAVLEEDGRLIAFVQVSGETFEKRDLSLGIREGNFVQVLSGIETGERVVVRGATAIRLASLSATIPAHGHAH